MATILVIDDDKLICILLRQVLGHHGHEVLTTTSGKHGIDMFQKHRPKATILDLRLPDLDGIEVLKEIRTLDSTASVIILTGAPSDDLLDQARACGVTDIFYKGNSLHLLNQAIARLGTDRPSSTPSS
jgi:two-component system NtrC family response regulator